MGVVNLLKGFMEEKRKNNMDFCVEVPWYPHCISQDRFKNVISTYIDRAKKLNNIVGTKNANRIHIKKVGAR